MRDGAKASQSKVSQSKVGQVHAYPCPTGFDAGFDTLRGKPPLKHLVEHIHSQTHIFIVPFTKD
jgi:hypothetical protein